MELTCHWLDSSWWPFKCERYEKSVLSLAKILPTNASIKAKWVSPNQTPSLRQQAKKEYFRIILTFYRQSMQRFCWTDQNVTAHSETSFLSATNEQHAFRWLSCNEHRWRTTIIERTTKQRNTRKTHQYIWILQLSNSPASSPTTNNHQISLQTTLFVALCNYWY